MLEAQLWFEPIIKVNVFLKNIFLRDSAVTIHQTISSEQVDWNKT